MVALFSPGLPVSHGDTTVSQNEQYQDLGTKAAKWDSAIINFIIYTRAFPTVTCQNIFVTSQKTN